MGIHCFPILQHQHAEQLGVCVQHLCPRTHHLAQFRQRDDDVGWRCQGKAVFETASVKRRPVDGRRACECVGRFDEQGTQLTSSCSSGLQVTPLTLTLTGQIDEG